MFKHEELQAIEKEEFLLSSELTDDELELVTGAHDDDDHHRCHRKKKHRRCRRKHRKHHKKCDD